jgi:hypothetical protein
LAALILPPLSHSPPLPLTRPPPPPSLTLLSPPPPGCRHQQLRKSILFFQNQVKTKEQQPDPLRSKPDLEQQRDGFVEDHYKAVIELMQLVRSQWEGVRERGAAELALKEAEAQVRGTSSLLEGRGYFKRFCAEHGGR